MNKIRGLMVVVATLVVSFSGSAFSSTGQTCDVKVFGWQNDPSGKNIWIFCSQDSAHVYNAWVTGSPAVPSGCPTVDMDTLKMYETVAVAAKLAGRNVSVWYNSCNSGNTRTIGAISLEQ